MTTDWLNMSFMWHVEVFNKSEQLQVRRRVVNDDFVGLKGIFAALASIYLSLTK